MTKDFTIIRAGTDVYGRPVYMTRYYRDWEQARFDALGFSLPYAQGGYMTRLGGGAEASSGAHDLAKCVDYIIEHLTTKQSDAVVREFREHGGAANRRDRDAKHGGMPPHLHNTLGADAPGSPMAEMLWDSYVSGGDGLAGANGRPSNAPDYEWRPNPLVLIPPPEADMKALVRDVRALTAKYNISLGMVARVALREARDGNKATTSRGRSARAALLALRATNWGPEPK